ncbi:MAG: glycosyltransferase [Ginsengibacter sp.]
MLIAINTIFFNRENELDFLKKILNVLIPAHPEHQFLIISEKDIILENCPNVSFVQIGVPPSNYTRWLIWIYFKLKKVFKEHRPDLVLNTGEPMISHKKVRQVVFSPDLKYILDPNSVSRGLRNMFDIVAPGLYRKVERIIVFSEMDKNHLIKRFRISESKIHILQFGAEEQISPISFEQRDSIKEKYAKGFEYFLFSGYINNSKHLTLLLKAFSAFKKRQRSNMQLLITGKEGQMFSDFKKLVELYKYKNDVHIITNLSPEEHQDLMSAAYSLIFPSQWDHSVHILLNALKYEVPSIVTKTGSLSEAGENAVLHFDAESIPDLAGKMMLLFKDEKFRKNLIENSKIWLDQKNFQSSIDKTWQIIEEASK